MTLQKKILTGYGVAVVLMGLVIAWAVGHIIELGRTSDAILHQNHKSVLAAENMIEALERQDSAVLMALFGSEQDGLEKFRENELVFMKWMTRAKDNVFIDGESQLVDTVEKHYREYIRDFSRFLELPESSAQKKMSRKAMYRQTIYPLVNRIREGCMELSTLNEELMYESNLAANRMAHRATWSTIIVAAAGIMATLAFSLVLSRRITKPLRRLMTAAQNIARGDYSVSVPVNTNDEIGSLAAEFNAMANRLSDLDQIKIEQIISEKQKNEAVLKSIGDGLVVFDRHLTVTDINPAASAILKVEAHKCISKTYRDILPDESVCMRLSDFANTRRLPEASEEDIMEIGMGGAKRFYSFAITCIPDEVGEIMGIVLMLKDVTGFKELDKLKTEFVMAASHELRTPLASLVMSIDLLQENASDKLNPREKELLQGAHDELKRLKSLVSDLLDLSKMESGEIELVFESVSLRYVLEGTHLLFKNQFEKSDIEYRMELPENLPDVTADSDKLHLVFTNLISNALRYVPESGRIQVLAKQRGNFIHVSVVDNGPGIPVEDQNRIFQKFSQVDGYEGGGSGLGLAICREIIRAHGGTIWVDSPGGEGGTALTFTVPISKSV